MDAVRAKVRHHAFLFFGDEPPVQQADLRRREFLLQPLPFRDDGLEVAAVRFLDARVNEVGLPPFLEFAANEVKDLRQFVGGAQKGLEAPAPGGQLINHRNVQIAVERQSKCARNGCRGHHQQVRITAFAHELLALGDAEPVLLINDDQAEVVRREAGLNQCVRANGQKCGMRSAECGVGRLAPLKVRCSLFAVRCFPTPCVQFHPNAQRSEPVAERLEMLCGQNFGGRHERDVEPAFQRHQRRAGGYGCFA